MADPNKWLGLMKWSMQYNDGTHETKKTPMSEEDKKFLEKVMKECVIDEVERMKQICEVMKGADPKEAFKEASADITGRLDSLDTDEAVEDFHVDLLEYMQDLVENLDNANALRLIGGLEVIIQVFEQRSGRMRICAVEVLGACAQNNPPCQEALAALGLLDKFLSAIADADAKCRLKILGAMSALIRGNAPLEKQFIDAPCNGVQMLCRLLDDSELKIKRKALFLLRALIFSTRATAATARECGAIPKLIGMIGDEDVDLRESCVNAILELSAADPETATICQEPSSPLRTVLQTRLKELGALTGEDAEMAQEEISLCNKLNDLALGKSIFSGIDQQLWVDREPEPTPSQGLGPMAVGAGAGTGAAAGAAAAEGVAAAAAADEPVLLLEGGSGPGAPA